MNYVLVFVVTLTKQRVIFVLFTQYIKANITNIRQRNGLLIKYGNMSELSKFGKVNIRVHVFNTVGTYPSNTFSDRGGRQYWPVYSLYQRPIGHNSHLKIQLWLKRCYLQILFIFVEMLTYLYP